MKKKITIIALSFLLLVGLAGTFGSSYIADAAARWDSCHKVKTYCYYPGDCRSYTDTNGDSICDLSQAEPQTSSADTTDTSSSDTTTTVSTAAAIIPTTDSTDIGAEDIIATDSGSIYYIFPILSGLFVLYGMTWLLSVKKVITTMLHRKIWNVILLVSALISCLLGIVLTMNIDLNTDITLPFDMLFWHVEAGIALGIVAFFHVYWHWRYFSKLLRVKA